MMTGTGRLFLHILRRDWFRIILWLVVLGLFAVAIPLAFEGMFSTDAERAAMAETMKNPAMIALVGIGYGFDNYQTAQMITNEMLLMTMIAVAIGNILMVVRHTRTAEDLGHLEMILALPVGRAANLAATLFAALIFNILIVLEHALLMSVLGIESMSPIGNLWYGLCLGCAGLFFAALTALVSQIANSPHAVTGISLAVFMLSYLLRAIGDIGNDALSLASPLGLLMRSKPYVDEQVWPFLIVIGVTMLLCVPTFVLQNRRDMDAGLLPQHAGRSSARKTLLSPLGLAWRLNRNTIFAWAIGMFILGAMYGSVFGDMENFVGSNDLLKAAFSNSDYSLTEQFLALLMVIIALICTFPSLILTLKLRREEKQHRIDNIAALSVSREKMMSSYVVLAVGCCMLMIFMACLGLWAAINVSMSDPYDFSMIVGAGMSYLPAMFVMCGLGFALTGILPRLTSAVWALLLYSFFATYIAELIDLSDWAKLASPFHYIKQLPVQEFDAVPLVVLGCVAVAFTALGYVGYHRRDLEG